jgi:hypothetical protein
VREVFAVEKKEVSRCAREEDQVLFLLDIFYFFFFPKETQDRKQEGAHGETAPRAIRNDGVWRR